EEERRRGADFAARLSVRVLSRAWQMLLTGMDEVQRAARPRSAAEMVLIRIAHAADLPTLAEALSNLDAAGSPAGRGSPAPCPGGGGAAPQAPSPTAHGATAMQLVARQEQPVPGPAPAPGRMQVPVASLEHIVALADSRRDLAFKVLVK